MEMEKQFLTRPIRWFVICEYPFGFVLPITAIQYDLGGKPTVLIVANDNLREDVFDAVKGGRAYLRPVPVTVIGEFEPGLAVVRSAQLGQQDLVFVPEELAPLGPNFAKRFYNGELPEQRLT